MYAVILARGKGTRLHPYTDDRPKNMVEVAGKPILEHQINQLKQAAITNVVIPVAYKPEVIYDYFGDGSKFGVRIQYLQETTNTGSTGAIKQALEIIPEDERDVLVIYGDILSNIDLKELLRAHRERRKQLTLWVRPNRLEVGVVQINDQGVVTSFEEKPTILENTAVCVISRNACMALPDEGNFFDDAPSLYREAGLMYTYLSDAKWWHIKDPEALGKADSELRQIFNTERQSPASRERN